jgi:hypothetical protein
LKLNPVLCFYAFALTFCLFLSGETIKKKYFQTNYIISSLVIFLLVTMANPVPMFFGVTIMAMGE